MTDPAVALRAAGFLALLVISGWSVARIGGRRVDAFAAVWWGLAVMSLVAVSLARAGRFSLLAIGLAAGGVTVGALGSGALLVRVRGRPGPAVGSNPWVPRFAWLMLAVTVAWCWPPFETFLAASDSTMYVDAGIHLARTGSYAVADSVARVLPPDVTRGLFASVGVLDGGPYIRLPGGLLKQARDAATAMPAFFPLLSAWTGILTAIGGPTLAPAIAPFAMGLAACAVTLFAGEMLGIVVAVPAALVFVANFAVWWFGRFAMPEPLTLAFVWGGLVFLGRGAPAAAGVMLGLGALARAETLLFALGAIALWAAWTPGRARDLVPLAAGASLAGVMATAGLVAAPNHHLAYLSNDLAFAWLRIAYRVLPAVWDGRVHSILVLLPLIPLTVGVTAAWRGAPIVRSVARFCVVLGLLLAVTLYARVGGRAEPLRHLGWLASSMSTPGLVLGVVGTACLWARGGPVVRLAVVLLVLVAAVFIPSPRVATFQPWAMRRFLPVVLPALALGAGAAIGAFMSSRHRFVQAMGAAVLLVVLALQLRPTLASRDAAYYSDNFASVRRIAEAIPADGVVVVDSIFADLQLQVPLWLLHGRETVMARADGAVWRALMPALVATGRAVYWIQNGLARPPQAPGLTFTRLPAPENLTVHLPNSPPDTPPDLEIRKVFPLGVYGVAAGDGEAKRALSSSITFGSS